MASCEFQEAAEAQAKALGFEPAAVYVPHPIQDRTDEEIIALAEDAFESIMAMICTS